MTLLSWAIIIIPLIFVLCMAFYAKRYVRDVTDYLASGRVAGRYVISVGDMTAGLSVITLVAMCEREYLTGMAMSFWSGLMMPVSTFMALGGYCVYRFRETRCLSGGQFMELRYSRKLRIVACTVRVLAEMVTNAIGPAVAVNFFIYFMDIPRHLDIFGTTVPTYTVMVAVLLLCALAIIWPAGRISLLITDCFQGMISYPIFVIFTVFVLSEVSWFNDVAPVMLDRVPGESFLNPMDVGKLRDFNMFALFVTLFGQVLTRPAWIGNDTTSSGRTAHEQKMAGILGSWRNGFSWTMMTLVGLFVVAFMLGDRFAAKSHDVRIKLTQMVIEEAVPEDKKEVRGDVLAAVAKLQPAKHTIGVDKPYSRKDNPDTPFLDTVKVTLLDKYVSSVDATDTDAVIKSKGIANSHYQKFRSLYSQMMMPVLLGSQFSPVLMGLFGLLMLMLLLSTDDSRIFNASSSIIQDLILPFRKTAISTAEHIKLLKLCSVAIVIFFFVVSVFFAQIDFIQMFTTIMCALWLGAAGPIMVGGLYTRFGTTAGAWSALAFGSGFPLCGLICQRNWADHIYPWLERNDYVDTVASSFAFVTKYLDPYIVWEMKPQKFAINSIEIYFGAMVVGLVAYLIASYLTYKEPFNLDRMFHRGIYSDGETKEAPKHKFSIRGVLTRIVGIDDQYTTGDKVIAWSVVIWTLGYNFGIMFVGVCIWNMFFEIDKDGWGMYFFIKAILGALIVGGISTVWFIIGGIIDTKALFRDLGARVANPLDNGQVIGHVNLCDSEAFEEVEHEHEHDNDPVEPSSEDEDKKDSDK